MPKVRHAWLLAALILAGCKVPANSERTQGVLSEQLLPPEKSAEVRKECLGRHPLQVTVSDKFITDHIFTGQKNEALSLAKRRFEKEFVQGTENNGARITIRNDRIPTYTWTHVTESELAGKIRANKDDVVAHVFNGKQQLQTRVVLSMRDVHVGPVKRSETQNLKHDLLAEYLLTNGTTIHMAFNVQGGTREGRVWLVGPWEPLTGALEIYHYHGLKPPHQEAMLDTYDEECAVY